MGADSTHRPNEAAPGVGNGRRSGPGAWLAAAITFLLALPCLRVPQTSLTAGLDDSWGGVLIYAHEKGLQFGREIAFTYGPLGIFSVSGFSPDVAWLRMIFEVLLCGMVATGLYLLAWRMAPAWRAVVLGFFLLVSAPIHWGGDDLLIELGLLFWGMLCWLESGPRLKIFAGCLAGLAAVCALIKFTLLVVAALTIVTLVCDLALRGRRWLAGGLLAGFSLVFLAGWVLLGQRPAGLGTYLQASLAISSGYNQAMGTEEISPLKGLLVAAAALAAAMLGVGTASLPDSGRIWLRRGLLLSWLAGLLFLEWKYGFIRADEDHVSCFLGFVPMIALALTALPPPARGMKAWARALALGCALLAAILMHRASPRVLGRVCRHTVERVAANLGSLLQPGNYVREQTSAYRLEQSRNQAPKCRLLIGRGTADVTGENQMFAVFNELNYTPRPVFQSYSAFTRPLMEMNERFYSSTNRPEFVLFNLAAIDGRFPPLEDAYVLRNLLLNYELTAEEGDFLLLHRARAVAPELALVREGDAQPGGMISLADYGDTNLWMELSLRPTWPGELRRILYKPPEVQLGVWTAPGKASGKLYHAPAPMLAAGFLASPLALTNQDVASLYGRKPLVRPAGYSVEIAPGTANFWQEKIHFRIYRIVNGLGVEAALSTPASIQ